MHKTKHFGSNEHAYQHLNIRLDKAGCEALANHQDIDLRKTTRLVREAFERALQAGELVAELLLPKVEGRLQMGFGS